MPSSSARARVVMMQSPAPSPTPLALPAVVLPSPHCGKAGFKAANPSRVTPGRMVSSTDSIAPFISTGIISSAKTPSASAWMKFDSIQFIGNSKRKLADFCCSCVRDVRKIILHRARNLVSLCNHFGSPPHGLRRASSASKTTPYRLCVSLTCKQSLACGCWATASTTSGVGLGLCNKINIKLNASCQ